MELEPLLNDPHVTEILVQNFQEIWFEKAGLLQRFHAAFSSPVQHHNFVQSLLSEARMKVDLETPQCDGEWRGFRVHVIQTPLCPAGTVLSLRRRAPETWGFAELAERGWASYAALDGLRQKVKNKKSILIAGATGAGKTSVLNACLKEVDPHERVITIEDTNELHLPNSISVKLLTREATYDDLKSYSQADLLKQCLRMRPDRIVVGEMRGGEAKDYLLALSTGHGGAMATIHANSARQALLRLEILVQMGAPEWRLDAIRQLIYLGIDSVVVVKKENGERKLDGIYQISSLEETGFCFEQIY